MKLTWHIVRKDLTRLRGWLAVWFLVLAWAWWLGAWALREAPRGSWNITDYIVVQMVAEAVIGYFMVVRLFQGDVVLGENSFWLTRPISHRRLLAAKALGAALIMVVLPVLMALPWWIWCGLDLVDILAGMRDILVLALLVGLPAALIGTVTEHFGRALLWTFVVLALPVLLIPILGALLSLRGDRAALGGLALSAPILLLAMAGVIGWVFATRRRSAWLLAVFPVALAAFGGMFARVSPQVVRATPTPLNAEAMAETRVRYERARVDPERRGMEFDQMARIGFLVTPSTPGLLSSGGILTWSWPGAEVQRMAWSGRSMTDTVVMVDGLKRPTQDAETERYLRRADENSQGASNPYNVALRAWRDAPLPEGAARMDHVAILPRSMIARMKNEPAAMRGTLWFRKLEPELMWESPLEAGEWTRVRGGGMRVVVANKSFSARASDGVALVLLRATSGSLLTAWDRLPHPVYNNRLRELLLTTNRERNEFRFVEEYRGRTLWLKGVQLQWYAPKISGDSVWRSGKWEPHPGWLPGAKLALVEMRETARFSREVQVEKFELPK